MTSTFAAAVGRGRHRLGRAGLVHVATFVEVARRGLFTSWRHPARHRMHVVPRQTNAAPQPAPAL